MGADMLLAVCESPQDLPKSFPIIEARIKALSNEVIEDLSMYFECAIEEIQESIEGELSEDDLYSLDDLINIKIRSHTEQELAYAIGKIFGTPESPGAYLRDCAEMNLNGCAFMFSGGQSWGDEPSESFTLINLIHDSGIVDGLGLDLPAE